MLDLFSLFWEHDFESCRFVMHGLFVKIGKDLFRKIPFRGIKLSVYFFFFLIKGYFDSWKLLFSISLKLENF